MNHYDEEEKMIESVEAGEWKPVDNLEEEKAKLKAAARATAVKSERMNIRSGRMMEME